jgi:hypothetical protein
VRTTLSHHIEEEEEEEDLFICKELKSTCSSSSSLHSRVVEGGGGAAAARSGGWSPGRGGDSLPLTHSLAVYLSQHPNIGFFAAFALNLSEPRLYTGLGIRC